MRKLVLAIALLVFLATSVLAGSANKTHRIYDSRGRSAGSFKQDASGNIKFTDKHGWSGGQITNRGVIRDRFGRDVGKLK